MKKATENIYTYVWIGVVEWLILSLEHPVVDVFENIVPFFESSEPFCFDGIQAETLIKLVETADMTFDPFYSVWHRCSGLNNEWPVRSLGQQ